jgi:hypothetical protein
MLAALLTFMVVGLVGLVVVAVVLAIIGAILGIAFGLVGFLLFKVAPIVLLGYLIVRFLAPRHKRLSAAEKRWLES